MKYYKIIPLFIVAFLMQLSVISHITVFGISPSIILTLIMIIIYLFDNEPRCVGCAVIVGLLLDITVGKYLGIYALTLFLVGICMIWLKGIFNYESRMTVIPVTAAGVFIYQGVPFLILALCGQSVNLLRFIEVFALSYVVNLLLMFILYFLMIRKASYRSGRSRYERYETI